VFDIGFGELLLVFVIGLIVLGPQRLPVAVKTVVGWIRAMRSLASSVQTELAHELKLQELQDSLKKVEKASMNHLTPELKASMDELREAADSMKRPHSPRDAEKQSDEEHTIHNPQTQPQAEENAPLSDNPTRNAQPQQEQAAQSVETAHPTATSSAEAQPARVLTPLQQAAEHARQSIETPQVKPAQPARELTPLQQAAERAVHAVQQSSAETLQINSAPETVKSLEPTSPLREKV